MFKVKSQRSRLHGKYPSIAKISIPYRKSGSTNPTSMSEFDRKLANSRFCAGVIRVWLPYAIFIFPNFFPIHPQQYSLWNTALLVHCNNAGIVAAVSGSPYLTWSTETALQIAPVENNILTWLKMISTSAPAKSGIMPTSSPWIIINVVNSCSYRQPLAQ